MAGWLVPAIARTAGGGKKLKVAAIVTAFFHRSHAHVILENFLVPYLFNGEVIDPREHFEIASLYVDQFGTRRRPDMARPVAAEFGIPLHETVTGALTLGGDDLAVDAVLMIGEHGDYPFNEKGQELYPKRRFFDEIVSVFEKSGRSVPVYSDKHLSHSFAEAREMVDTAKRLDFGLMAGSSVPLAERRPPMDPPAGSRIAAAVSIHGGPLERYGFHGLEVLQSIVETRAGGETGVASVRYLEGESLWRAADDGSWSEDLANLALRAEMGPGAPPLRRLLTRPGFAGTPPHGFLLRYRDGLRAIVLKIGVSGIRWDFACRLDGRAEPLSTYFHGGPWDNRNLFKALAHAIQSHFLTGKPPCPVERTLLAGGALEAAIDSKIAGGAEIATPHLEFAHETRDFSAYREMGKTWETITEDTPQPPGIEPVGIPDA